MVNAVVGDDDEGETYGRRGVLAWVAFHHGIRAGTRDYLVQCMRLTGQRIGSRTR